MATATHEFCKLNIDEGNKATVNRILSESLSQNKNNLELDFESYTEEFFQYLFTRLNSEPGIKVLTIQYGKLEKEKGQIVRGLTTPFREKHLIFISTPLSSNQTLLSLGFPGNHLLAQGLNKLLTLIKPTLIRDLNISGNEVRSDGIKYLLQAFESGLQLTSLNLSQNFLGAEDPRALTAIEMDLDDLLGSSLDENIAGAGASVEQYSIIESANFLALLIQVPCLKNLDLTGNKFNAEQLKILEDAYQRKKKLMPEFILRGVPFSQASDIATHLPSVPNPNLVARCEAALTHFDATVSTARADVEFRPGVGVNAGAGAGAGPGANTMLFASDDMTAAKTMLISAAVSHSVTESASEIPSEPEIIEKQLKAVYRLSEVEYVAPYSGNHGQFAAEIFVNHCDSLHAVVTTLNELGHQNAIITSNMELRGGIKQIIIKTQDATNGFLAALKERYKKTPIGMLESIADSFERP